MAKKSGLGKGLGALIPDTLDTAVLMEDGERVRKLAVQNVVPDPGQPRKHFDQAALTELADSIRVHGVVQPLVVSPAKAGQYVLIAGERRWRAAQLAGLKTVPAVVRTTQELERLELALVENVQRVDLSPLEQALSIERLHQQFNLSYQSIAGKLGKAETTISNLVRLLQLPAAAQKALANHEITEGHARQIVALKAYPEKQHRLLELIIAQEWSVRQAEHYAAMVKNEQKQTEKKTPSQTKRTPDTADLSSYYQAPVRVRRTGTGGKIEIAFTSDEQLNELIQKLRGVSP